MAESSEWKRKGASMEVEKISQVYDVGLDFLGNAINAGRLEVRYGTTAKGRQWRKVLRSQVEWLINSDPLGALHLARLQSLKDLQNINREINFHRKKLEELQVRKVEIELWRNQNPMPQQRNVTN